ncbi:hypothetical protein [Acinetobacter pollinis]|uniref:hypothetical protein n=1 Tax=Acinetobacter pollinis TaxID=2605270 RepID=UPI0018A2B685|nr:hypothetical protein [Acinetobacter pollinis]MBF7691571.1 hypothetical protein [Acinetobacter pollinis]MBF7699247.1 hypothetical protein [Acinetobacter pollinis]
MTDLEKEVQEAFEEMAHKMGMCLDQYWGDGYDNPYENDDTHLAYNIFLDGAKSKQAEIVALKQKLEKLESGEFVLVPKLPARKGGYYIRDTRLPIGNCMKFWYTHGYGTKHSKFHWFETVEQAQHHAGGAGWFEIWYAPYIDSIIESTVDIQKAYRSEEKAMIEALEKDHE